MRSFSCRSFNGADADRATILAQDEMRAGILARRILIDHGGAGRVEIREHGHLLRVEHAVPATLDNGGQS